MAPGKRRGGLTSSLFSMFWYVLNCLLPTNSLLQFNDSEEKYVVMPTLIAETILDRAPLYFSDYEPTLRYVLCKISIDEILPSDFSSIYQTIMNVIYYFQPNAAFLKARPSKTDLAAYNNWNTFLLDIITYFYTLGNTVMADELISELYRSLVQQSYPRLPWHPQPVRTA